MATGIVLAMVYLDHSLFPDAFETGANIKLNLGKGYSLAATMAYQKMYQETLIKTSIKAFRVKLVNIFITYLSVCTKRYLAGVREH